MGTIRFTLIIVSLTHRIFCQANLIFRLVYANYFIILRRKLLKVTHK